MVALDYFRRLGRDNHRRLSKLYGWEKRKSKTSCGAQTVDYEKIAAVAGQAMKTADQNRFLVVCAPRVRPVLPRATTRGNHLRKPRIRSAARYKVDTSQMVAGTRTKLLVCLEKNKSLTPISFRDSKCSGKNGFADANTAHEKRIHELWTFGWWFASEIFDDDWALEHLAAVLRLTGKVEVDHLVAKRLVKTVESKPKLTVECLSGMVEGVKEIYEILGWDKEAKTILAAALKSGDAEAKATAAALINRLDARGLSGFRELLDDGTVWLNRA
jgi:hypothetical protein